MESINTYKCSIRIKNGFLLLFRLFTLHTDVWAIAKTPLGDPQSTFRLTAWQITLHWNQFGEFSFNYVNVCWSHCSTNVITCIVGTRKSACVASSAFDDTRKLMPWPFNACEKKTKFEKLNFAIELRFISGRVVHAPSLHLRRWYHRRQISLWPCPTNHRRMLVAISTMPPLPCSIAPAA